MRINRTLFKVAVAGLALAGTMSWGVTNANAAPTTTVKPAASKLVFGPSKNVGNGKASSFIKLDSAGNPLAMGFVFSDKCLTGLPPGNFDTATSFELQLPAENPTGFNHLEMDWNPQGHDPKPIYGVPHFDFHFYLCDDQMLNTVMGGPDKVPVDAKYSIPNYISTVMTVPHMGTHWVDSTSPELHGKPFTATCIYGYYKGDMKFVEPMVALNFLQSKKPFHLNIK
ncbi:MAG: DUF5602 domain-containing protein, partial [Abditibacteriaceae bacterium]